MSKFLPGPILGVFAALLWLLNTLVWSIFFFIVSLFKLLLPIKMLRIGCTALLDELASSWMMTNNVMINLFLSVKWQVIGDVSLLRNGWYLVIANHQSWVDIVALAQVLNRRIPLLKFFLKKELIYVPILGFTWWALDFPFMHRYSKKLLKQKPYLKGKDWQATMKACEKFKHTPISIVNFSEGTRFTKEKQARQNSPYHFLLKPKAGGIAYTLQTMGQQLNSIIDVTIVYPDRKNTLWQLFTGKIKTVKIYLREVLVEQTLLGDYQNDREFRVRFQSWLNNVWQHKDEILKKELSSEC